MDIMIWNRTVDRTTITATAEKTTSTENTTKTATGSTTSIYATTYENALLTTRLPSSAPYAVETTTPVQSTQTNPKMTTTTLDASNKQKAETTVVRGTLKQDPLVTSTSPVPGELTGRSIGEPTPDVRDSVSASVQLSTKTRTSMPANSLGLTTELFNSTTPMVNTKGAEISAENDSSTGTSSVVGLNPSSPPTNFSTSTASFESLTSSNSHNVTSSTEDDSSVSLPLAAIHPATVSQSSSTSFELITSQEMTPSSKVLERVMDLPTPLANTSDKSSTATTQLSTSLTTDGERHEQFSYNDSFSTSAKAAESSTVPPTSLEQGVNNSSSHSSFEPITSPEVTPWPTNGQTISHPLTSGMNNSELMMGESAEMIGEATTTHLSTPLNNDGDSDNQSSNVSLSLFTGATKRATNPQTSLAIDGDNFSTISVASHGDTESTTTQLTTPLVGRDEQEQQSSQIANFSTSTEVSERAMYLPTPLANTNNNSFRASIAWHNDTDLTNTQLSTSLTTNGEQHAQSSHNNSFSRSAKITEGPTDLPTSLEDGVNNSTTPTVTSQSQSDTGLTTAHLPSPLTVGSKQKGTSYHYENFSTATKALLNGSSTTIISEAVQEKFPLDNGYTQRTHDGILSTYNTGLQMPSTTKKTPYSRDEGDSTEGQQHISAQYAEKPSTKSPKKKTSLMATLFTFEGSSSQLPETFSTSGKYIVVIRAC